MSTVPRRVARIGLVAALVLTAGIAGSVYLRSDALRRHITPILEGRVGVILGSPVRIRDFHRVGPRREELAVQVMEQDGSTPVLAIDSLQLSYRLRSLLRGDVVITDVVAKDVGIHVRRVSADDLNIAALVEAVSAEDEGGGLSIETFVGSIRLERVSVVAGDVIDGFDIVIPDLAIDSVTDVPLPLSGTRPFALHADEWTITRGDHSQTLGEITASGTVNADRVDITDGLLIGDGARISAHGRIAFTQSVDLTVDGVVSADTIRPLYPDMLRDARGAVELEGLRITGDLGDPVVEGPWAFRDALWGQVLVAAGAGALRWQGGDAVLRDVEVSVFGGSTVASVRADDLGAGTLEIEATATGLDIARLREAFAPSAATLDAVAGTLDGTFVATLHDDGMLSTGKWSLREFAWSGVTVGDGSGVVTHHVDGDRFEAHVTLAGDTRVALYGALPSDESLDIDISFAAEDVAPIAMALGQDAQGSARGAGRITGSTAQPVVEMETTLLEGAWRGLPILNAAANLRWEDDTLHVASASVASGDGTIAASATVTFAPDGSPPQFDIVAQAAGFQLDPYVAILFPGIDFSAAVNGEARVAGSLDSHDGEATVSLANATYAGVPIALHSVSMAAVSGRWTAAPFELRVGAVPFDARANFDVETYAFSADSPDAVPIRDFLTWLPNASDGALRDAKGFVRLTTEGAGSFSSPVAQVTARLSDASFRSARLGDSEVTFSYDSGSITGSGALADGAYALHMTGEVTSGGVPFEASLKFADTDVLPLIRLAGQPAGKGLTSTTVGGEAVITGDLTRWREALASVDLASLRLRTPDYELSNVDPVRGSISASGIDLSPIVMQGADPAHPFDVEVRGLLDLHKPIAFDVVARTFDLDMVSDFMGLPGLAKGVGTYRLDVQGTAAEPVVTMSWDVPKARIALRDGTPPLDIENVQGEAEYRDRVVTLHRMSMRLGGRDVDVTGEIPMALTFVLVPLVEQLVDAPLRLSITTQQDDLSWLPSLHPLFQEAEGSAAVTLEIAGSIRSPRVSGSAQVNASRVALEFSNRPVENIVVTASFSSDDAGLVVADVTTRALVGDGRVTGTGSFTYPLDLVNWRTAFDPDRTRGAMEFDLDGLLMSRLVEFAGGEAPPLEVEMSGSARLTVTGADPRRWTGSVTICDAELRGNDRLLPNQGPITASYDGSILRLDRCDFGMGPQSLALTGALREDGTWEGRAAATSLDVTILGRFLTGSNYPRGQLTATAILGGSATAPTMDAKWHLRDLIYGRFELALFEGSATYADGMLTLHWDLESFGNHMTVEGHAPLEVGLEGGNVRIARPDLPMSLALNTEEFDISFASLLFPSVSEASGKALIDLSINGTSLHPEVVGRVQMPDAAITLAHNGMRLDRMQAYIDARPGRIDVDKFRFYVGPARYEMVSTSLHLDLNVLQTSMTITNASAEAWFPTPGTGEDPLATLITGKIAAHVDVAGLRREGLFNRAETGSELFERAVRLTSHVQGQAQLSSLRVGWLGYDLSNDPDTPVRLTFDKGLLTLDQVELKQAPGPAGGRHGSVSASGAWEIGGDLDVRARGRLGAAFISDWLAEHVFTQPGQTAPAATGSFDYAIHVTGPDANPRVEMSMTSSDLALDKLRLDSVAATASYADGVLTLDNCRLTASDSVATLRGSMPFEVSLYEAKARPRDADMQMQLDAILPNADVLPLLFPFIGRADGTGEVHLSIGGRLDNPTFHGGIPGRPAIALRGLRLSVPASSLELSGVEVAIAARGDHFQIDRLEGVANQGTFTVTRGTVDLTRGIPTAVDISVVVDSVTLAKPRLYRARGSATLRMHGPLERVQIDGDVALSNLNYRRDWKDLVRESLRSKALIALREGARFQYPVVRGMVVDLRVRADAENVAFDTGAGNVGGDIDGQIVGPLTELVFYGEVRRMRGEFAYRGRRFEIESGYAENLSTTVFNPTYEITATSMETLRGVGVVDTQGVPHTRDVDVTISVSGTLERPSPEFEITVLDQGPGEDYAMTPTESIALLTWGMARPQATGDAVSGELVDIVGNRMASSIGIDMLNVDLDPDAPEDTRIQITKEISDRVAFTYGSTFQIGQEQRLEIDYQLDRHIGISGERNEEGKYGVDLKLEYEFR